MNWRRDIIAKISQSTEPDEEASRPFGEKRAPCPLCKYRGSQAFGNDGYKLPDGLARHLDGHGNVHSCDVLEAGFKGLRDSNRDKFAAAEKAEADHLAHRKRTEPVMLIDPVNYSRNPVVLFDEGFVWGKQAWRTPEQLVAAEQTLREIGFTIEKTDNVTAYKFLQGDWMVLADPRKNGQVEYRLFKRSGKRSWKLPPKGHDRSFSLNDNRKEMAATFENELQRCVRGHSR
jgi:hypothetical protein